MPIFPSVALRGDAALPAAGPAEARDAVDALDRADVAGFEDRDDPAERDRPAPRAADLLPLTAAPRLRLLPAPLRLPVAPLRLPAAPLRLLIARLDAARDDFFDDFFTVFLDDFFVLVRAADFFAVFLAIGSLLVPPSALLRFRSLRRRFRKRYHTRGQTRHIKAILRHPALRPPRPVSVRPIFQLPTSPAIPETLARVVPGHINPTTLGVTDQVFVTDASLLRGLNAAQVAEKLEIPVSRSFRIIEFPSQGVNGLAVPIRNPSPGFIGNDSRRVDCQNL